MKIEQKCKDFGDRPGCLGDNDERYTMRFDDLGEEPLYWCASCGPPNHAMDKALTEFMMASPENVEKVKKALDQVKCTHRRGTQ
jgi:hypothetical protein